MAVNVAAAIRDKLTSALKPLRLEVIDDSARHEGHAGSRPGGQSHFRVLIVSSLFEGMSRLARQKLVYATLAQELAGPVHALSVTARTPDEAG
ncbi:MAG: BolA family protein [Rhizomicrobium sp.]